VQKYIEHEAYRRKAKSQAAQGTAKTKLAGATDVGLQNSAVVWGLGL
jgi:hypothetical protein